MWIIATLHILPSQHLLDIFKLIIPTLSFWEPALLHYGSMAFISGWPYRLFVAYYTYPSPQTNSGEGMWQGRPMVFSPTTSLSKTDFLLGLLSWWNAILEIMLFILTAQRQGLPRISQYEGKQNWETERLAKSHKIPK